MRTCSNGHSLPDQDSSDGTLLSSCPICNASLLITDSLKTGPNLVTEALEGTISKTENLQPSDPSMGGDKTEPLIINNESISNPGSQQTLEIPENNSSNHVQQTEITKIFEEKEPTKVVGGQTTNHPTLSFDFKNYEQTVEKDHSSPSYSLPTLDSTFSPPKVSKGISQAPKGYELVGEIGRGAMGVVYKARQTGLKRLVALKMVLAAGRASKLELTRFQIEAEAVAKLDHPNIVKIYEIGEVDGLPFFSLEFVSGGTLSGRIKSNPATARQAATIMRGIAEGMDFAHKRGIVHRDLKPANILLSAPDQTGEDVDFSKIPLDRFTAKITDFGLAKTLEEDSIQTREGAIMGTPSYMAPEQAMGKTREVGPVSDIYGLGAILYDLLTGIPPFRGETVMDTIQQVIHREPVPPTRLNTKLPTDLGTICLKCLEKDPKKRYSTAGELAADLRRYLDGEPIIARPTPVYEKAWKWARRKPAQAALAGMVTMVALFASIGGYWLALHEKTRADENFRLKEQANREKSTAIAQKQKAEENFRLALAAVEQLLTKVGQNRLAHEPRMERTRRELLVQAKQFLNRFTDERADDPALQWQNGRTLAQLGSIEEMLGNFQEAEKNLNLACKQLQIVLEKQPDDPKILADLADSYQALGLVLAQLKSSTLAQDKFEQSITLRKNLPLSAETLTKQSATLFQTAQLLKDQGKLKQAQSYLVQTVDNLRATLNLPGTGDLQKHSLLKALLGLAQADLEDGNFKSSSKSLEEALEIGSELVKKHADNPDYRIDLALAWNEKGKLWKDLDPAKSEASYKEAITIQDSLIADFPATPYYRQELAGTLNNLGILLQAVGNSNNAENAFNRSINIRDKLAKDIPWVPDHRKDLAAGLNNRGIQLQIQNRIKEARPLYEKALADLVQLVGEHPKSLEYSLELAKTYLNESVLLENLGQKQESSTNYEKCLELLTKLNREHPDSQEVRKTLATAKLNRAIFSQLSQPLPETVKLYEESIQLFDSLKAEFPDQVDFQHQQALALLNLGNLLKDNNQGNLAEKNWLAACDLLEKLIHSRSSIPKFKLDLALAYNELGIHLASTKRSDVADQTFEKAVSLLRELLAGNKDALEYRLELGKTYSNLGMWAVSRNLGPKAVDYFTQAIQTLQAGPSDNPLLLESQALPMVKKAEILKLSGLFPEAEKEYRKFVELRSQLSILKPNDLTLKESLNLAREQLAIFLVQRNRSEEAFPILQKIGSDTPNTASPEIRQKRILNVAEIASTISKPKEAHESLKTVLKDSLSLQNQIKAATLAARCASLFEKEKQADQASECKKLAISLLQKAVAGGLRDADFLKKNPDLESIRGSAEFQELLKSVEMKK